MSNVIEFTRNSCDQQYLIGQQSLDELAAISRQLTAAQSDLCRCCDHLEGIEYLGEILADVERHPVEDRPHIDVQGQVLMIGIFSDLCRYRDKTCPKGTTGSTQKAQLALTNSEVERGRARDLDAIVKRLGKLIERYEP